MAKVKTTKRQPKKAAANAKKAAAKDVRVKNAKELLEVFDSTAEKLVHQRRGKTFNKKTRETIVSYGPWLASVTMLVILPELLVFAKTGTVFGLVSFFDIVLFNQQSWVLLVIMFVNAMLLADSLSDIFAKKRRGWSRVYAAHIITAAYIVIHLISNITAPAAPLISLACLGFLLFVLYDVRSYYKK